MTYKIKLVDKDIKTDILTIFHTLNKLGDRLSMFETMENITSF